MFKVELVVSHRHRDGRLRSQEQLAAVEHQAVAVFSSLFEGRHEFHRTVGYLSGHGNAGIDTCIVIFSCVETGDGLLDRVWAVARTFDAVLDQALVLFIITRLPGQAGYAELSQPFLFDPHAQSVDFSLRPDSQHETAVYKPQRFNTPSASSERTAIEGFQRLVIRLFK